MKTVCLKGNVIFAKANIHFGGAIIGKVLIFLWYKVISDYTAWLNSLCIENQQVLRIIFSQENSLVSLYVTEKNVFNFAVMAPSKRMFVFAKQTLAWRHKQFSLGSKMRFLSCVQFLAKATFEPPHDKMTVRPPILIRVFAVRSMGS